MSRWILFLALMGLVVAGPIDAESAETEVSLDWGVRIPMRDGVELNATVFRPRDVDEPLPTIFTLTPYTSDTYQDRAWYFSRQISKGSRLRLVLKSPNSIYGQKNYNAGGVVVEESGADARTATIRQALSRR